MAHNSCGHDSGSGSRSIIVRPWEAQERYKLFRFPVVFGRINDRQVLHFTIKRLKAKPLACYTEDTRKKSSKPKA